MEIVERYCGAGSPVEKKLAPYMKYVTETTTAQLNV
jgi:adenylosuccinate lyase